MKAPPPEAKPTLSPGKRFLVILSAFVIATAVWIPSVRCLEIIDGIIAETTKLEREKTFYHFLMDYARAGEFVNQPERSLFVDGEIALMLGARRLLEERADYKPLLQERVARMVEPMSRGPVLCAESYPNECWLFCNTVALATRSMGRITRSS